MVKPIMRHKLDPGYREEIQPRNFQKLLTLQQSENLEQPQITVSINENL